MSHIFLLHNHFKSKSLTGRYITPSAVADSLQSLNTFIAAKGKSVLGHDIYSYTLGEGPIKILMWSQMHGNESTTTKAVADLLLFLNSKDILASKILQQCTVKIIPVLNPDGAIAYTRENANNVDLNRDAKNLSQPESKILREIYSEFNPDFCFNLHDQRTIFNVGLSNKPATVSFLAPATDAERNINNTREVSMQLIAAINNSLQQCIPGQIGRYDDTFNDNCVGDTFQLLGTPTLLFEAGHFYNDYYREKTREFIFFALVFALQHIINSTYKKFKVEDYLAIPENNKMFFDVLVRNVNSVDAGILFKEVLKNNEVCFEPYLEKSGNLSDYFGHVTFNASNSEHVKLISKHPKLSAIVKSLEKS